MEIKLTKNKIAIVADEHFEWLNQNKWYSNAMRYAMRYASRGEYVDGKKKCIYMHREVVEKMIGRKLLPGEQVDHINHNGYDNHPNNLRIATQQQNNFNTQKRQNCSSIYKGVSFDKSRNKWVAFITVDTEHKYLGRFTNEIDAAVAYKRAAIEFYGEFACIDEFACRVNPERKNYKTIEFKQKSSQYIGVSFDKSRNKWAAYFDFHKKRKHLGRFDTELEASEAVEKAKNI